MSHTTTNCVTYTGASQTSAMTIIAIGKQQWGKSSSSGRATTTVTLPISMASAIYAVAISQAAASDTWSTWSSIVSNAQIKLTNNYGPGSWWLVIGKQQWGKTSSFAIYKSITFSYPISCSTCYVASATTGSTGETALQITNIGVSSCTIYRHYTGSSGGSGIAYVIVIGKAQQWGKANTSSDSAITIAFPITFGTLYCVTISKRSDNTSYGAMLRTCVQSSNNASFVTRGGYQSYCDWIAAGKAQQWGYNNTSSAATIYFPIAFPSACYSVVLGGYRQCTGNQRATSITKTSFYLGGDSASDAQYSRWMAVGSQQWGYVRNGAAPQSVNFPISYTASVLSIHVTPIYAGGYTPSGFVHSAITLSSVKLNAQRWDTASYHAELGTYYWTSIGVQQWGYATRSGKGDTTFSFPLTFNTVYAVNAGRYFKSRDDSNSGHGVMSHTTTNCVTYTGASQTSAMTIIAIGKQQWGKSSSSGRATTTVTLPISMASAIYAVAISQAAASDTWSTWSSIVSNAQIKLTNNYGPGSWWLVIGKQQWGKTSSFAIYKSITFSYPISCSTCYVASATTGSTGETALQITNIGVSSCTIYRHYTGSSGGSGIAYVIVIGKAQQWGKANTSSDSAITIAFPITFGTLYCVTISKRSDNTSYGAMLRTCVQSSNNASFVTRGGYQSYCDWIAAGKAQQWGYLSHSGNTTGQTVPFNISFPTSCYSVVASRTDSGATSYWTFVIHTDSVTTTKFQCHLANNLYWIAIGKQQWGYNSNNAAGATTGFPISFASACYGVVHCSGNTGRIEGNPYITSVTTTTIKWGQYGLGYWIAFGL